MSTHRMLFRNLLRVGRRIDKHPQLRALLYSDEMKFSITKTSDSNYFEEEHRRDDFDYELLLDDTDRAMKHLIESYCGGGVLYKPNQLSLVDSIKANFRCPPKEVSTLSSGQITELCFMAMRVLYTTQRLGCELFNVDESSSRVMKLTTNSRRFEEVARLQSGAVLVSHPMHLGRPCDNSVLLVASIDDEESTCKLMQLNKLWRDKSGTILHKKLKQKIPKLLQNCTLYFGGSDYSLVALHRHEQLAGVSTKIVFPRSSSSSSNDLEGCIGDKDMAVQESNHPATLLDRNSPERVHQEAVGELDSVDASDSLLDDGYIYMTEDLAAVGVQIAEAAISTKDIKIVYGCYKVHAEDLESDIWENKFFVVTPKYPNDIIMSTAQMTAIVDQSQQQVPTAPISRKKVCSDFNMWGMVLRGMGGEYAAFSSIKNVMALPDVRIQALFNEWNKHPNYGEVVLHRMKHTMDDNYDSEEEDEEEDDEDDYEYDYVSVEGLMKDEDNTDYDDTDDNDEDD